MTAPADLYGRPRPDRMYRALASVVAAYRRLSERGERRQPPVRAVDRDLRLVVRAVAREAEGVVSLTLGGRGPLPAWRPGCHVDVVLPSGRVRQYSLCGDPADARTYRIAVRLVPGGSGSAEAHGLAVGDALVVRGPRNAFPFVGDGPWLFVAGGIGITPILPMVRHAAASGADWRLVYTGRSRDSLPFLAELGSSERVVVRADDEHGLPTAADLLSHAPSGAAVYCCGPMPMVDLLREAWPGRLHFERFSAPPVVGGRPFELQLGAGGPVVPVAADESALTALRQVRPDIAYSCGQGFCGTCRIPVLAGEIAGSSEEDSMRVCVSRAAGERVVLDM